MASLMLKEALAFIDRYGVISSPSPWVGILLVFRRSQGYLGDVGVLVCVCVCVCKCMCVCDICPILHFLLRIKLSVQFPADCKHGNGKEITCGHSFLEKSESL